MYVCVSGDKKYLFYGKVGGLFFLETPVLKFVLLPYYRRYRVHPNLANTIPKVINDPVAGYVSNRDDL